MSASAAAVGCRALVLRNYGGLGSVGCISGLGGLGTMAWGFKFQYLSIVAK